MIQIPRRSVTRFFIPMIDVLTLLFCMFLLMPILRENETLSQEGSAGAGSAAPDDLKREIEQRQKELEELYGAQQRARITLAELEKKPGDFIRKNFYYRTLYISPKDGSLTFFDPNDPAQGPIKIATEDDARNLIARHQKEAGFKKLFYKFERLYDPAIKEPAFPRGKQMETYQQQWFRDVATESYVTSAGGER